MTTYYIDYKNGNDGNTGGSGDPWKTLNKFLTTAGNNDTCLARGTDAADEIYYESGLATVLTGLTIAADTGHTPTFSPSTAYTAWVPTGGTTNVYETAYVVATLYVVWNGATELALVANIPACDATPNSYYFDNPGNKLYVNIGGGAPTSINAVPNVNSLLSSAAAGITYSNLRIQWAAGGFILNNAGTVNTCTVRYHSGGTTGTRNAFLISATSGTVTITDCTVNGLYSTTAGTRGIYQTGACTLVVNGYSVDGAAYGYYQSNVGGTLTIANSTFANCDDGITIDSAGNAVAATISYCEAYDFGHSAYQFTGAAVTATIHHSFAWVPGTPNHVNWHGFICETGATVNIYNCVSVGALTDGFLVQSANSTAIVKNCAAINCVLGFKANFGIASLTANYNGVYGNTADYGGTLPWAAGANDVSSDPLMTSLPDDITLGAGSPYRGAGEYIAGVSEFNPATIGRYEYPLGAFAPFSPAFSGVFRSAF